MRTGRTRDGPARAAGAQMPRRRRSDGATRERTTMSFAWKKVAVGIATAGLVIGLSACSQERDAADEPTGSAAVEDTLIGIAMPTKSLERWNHDGAHLEELLKEAGYETTLQYADNKVDQQITQLAEHDQPGRQGPRDRLDRRHGARAGPRAGGDQRRQGHRVRPPDQRHRRTSTTTRRSTTRRSARSRASSSSTRSTSRTPRARSTSSPSPARRTTTTPSSSSPARGTSSCRTSRRASSSSRRASRPPATTTGPASASRAGAPTPPSPRWRTG